MLGLKLIHINDRSLKTGCCHDAQSVTEGTVVVEMTTQVARLMGPTWGPRGSCRPQVGPMLAPWTLPSGKLYTAVLPQPTPSDDKLGIVTTLGFQ